MTRHYLLVPCIPCAACTAVPGSRPADLCRLLGVPMAPLRHPGIRLTSARRGGTKGPPPVGHTGCRSGGETALSSAARADGSPATAQTPPASRGGREREREPRRRIPLAHHRAALALVIHPVR